jgi:hypothetical protein
MNPECRVGKCGNCNGQALDMDLDEFVECQHHCHGNEPTTPKEYTRP